MTRESRELNPFKAAHRCMVAGCAAVLVALSLSAVQGIIARAAGTMDEEPAASATATPAAPTAPEKKPVNTAKIQSLLDAKRYPDALVEIEAGLKVESKNAELLKQKGFALREQGKFKEAVESYIDALKINPALDTAKEYLGVTYLKMGEVKPAKQLYKELLKSSPELAKMMKAEADKLKIKL